MIVLKRRTWILVIVAGSLAILLALAENQTDFLRTNADEMPENDSESQKKNITYYTKYYQTKKSIYESYTHKSSETIFLGDSLTDYYEWGEALSDYEVLNRGIAGDTTTGVLNRIDEVVKAKPDRIYLLIGINDLIAGQSVNKIETNYKQILDTLKTRSPHTKVYVQSLFPVNTALTSHPLKNATIKELNKRLKDLANLYNYRFIDIYPDLVEFGQLNKDFTFDGIHLNGEGYRIWTRKVLSTYNTNEKPEK